MNDNNKQILKALKYIKKFNGMKYKFSKNAPIKENVPPFWIGNTKPPKFEYIYKNGSNCAGLVNLVRKYMKLEIPGDITGLKKGKFIGGTGEYFNYLKKMNRLEKINFNKVYPIGCLLIQNYNLKDQGHLAILLSSSKKGLLYSKIIHNCQNTTLIEKLNEFSQYNRFTHICLPEKWLLLN